MKSLFFICRCNQTGSPLTTPNFSTPYDKDIPSCFTNDTVPQCTEFDYESPIFVSSVVDEVIAFTSLLLTLHTATKFELFFLNKNY